MKQVTLFLIAIAISSFAIAQAYEGTVEYDKKKQQSFMIDYNYPAEAVENAIIQKMEKLGYKGKEEKGLFNKDKGFRVYKNAFITDISRNSLDYIIKIDPKGRKEKDESVLYLLIFNKDGENVLPKFDAFDVRQAKTFLNNLLPDVESANLELQIKDQEEMVVKTEKKFKNLQSDKEDMENKIKKLQEDIQKNIKDQDDTQKEIENQKQVLEALKLKRKSPEKTL
ncbi:MAG: hypothetical protein ABUT20_17615 [Bacteroidota bacterium]